MTKISTKRTNRSTENRESRLLVKYCFILAKKLDITKILIYAESVQDQRYIFQCRNKEKIFLLTRKEQPKITNKDNCEIIHIPDQDLSRSEQFQLGLFVAVLKNQIKVDETVLCMTGLVGSRRLDNLLITNLQRDCKWLKKHSMGNIPKDLFCSQEFSRLLDIALRFAHQGREGKAIGTIFLLGDYESLKQYTRQLVLNPFQGHKRRDRSIHNNEFIEIMREFSTLDGAFIIDNQGIVECAGAYLNPPSTNYKINVPKGYGARHTAAALMTASTHAIAFVISESSSSVMVFFNGSPILQLNEQ